MYIPPLTGTIVGKLISWSYNFAKCKLLANKIKFNGSLEFHDGYISGNINLIIDQGINNKLIFYGVQFFEKKPYGRDKLIHENLEEYNFGHGQYINKGANFNIKVNLVINDAITTKAIYSKKVYYIVMVKFSNGCIISSPKHFI